MLMGAPGFLNRSFPAGKKDFMRITRGRSLHLEVSLSNDVSEAKVALYTDMPVDDFQTIGWKNVEFQRAGSSLFVLDMLMRQTGIFRFKIKFSLDGGQSWQWDRGQHTYVAVDPIGLETSIKLYTFIPPVSGHIGEWKDWLIHAKNMGFNYIHFLPLVSMDKSRNPYSALDIFSMDDIYRIPGSQVGTLEQFEEFVEFAKDQGMRLCIDIVLNHIGVTSQIAKACPEWIVADEDEIDGFKRAGWWGDQTRWFKWEDVILLNYDHPNRSVRSQLWQYMRDYVLFWANYAHFTGGMIRFDNFHSCNESFIRYVMSYIRKEYPDLLILAELFSDESTTHRLVLESGLTLILATPWESKFTPQLRAYIGHIHHQYKTVRYLFPITSHDSGTPVQEFGDVNSTYPRYVISALCGSGCTGMVQGVEFGLAKKINFMANVTKLPLEDKAEYSKFITRINDLIEQFSAFRTGGNLSFIDEGHDAIIGVYRTPPREAVDEPGFIVLANLDIHKKQHIVLHLSKYGINQPLGTIRFEDMLSSEILTSPVDGFHMDLNPCGVKIFKILKS